MLPPGTEVDYNVAHELWVPARVEAPTDGGGMRLRFSVGGTTEVTQALSAEEVARRIAPAGTQTLPFLDGQPVDVLRRTRASTFYPPQEQWQRGECGRAHFNGNALTCMYSHALQAKCVAIATSLAAWVLLAMCACG